MYKYSMFWYNLTRDRQTERKREKLLAIDGIMNVHKNILFLKILDVKL